MSSALARVASIVAMIVGIPALCGGGVLYYGKVLSEAEVAEGTLRTPEQTRQLLAELERRFQAMTPAEHVAEARRELDCGYNAETRMGGNFRAARRHLEAVPAGVEGEGVAAVRAEMTRREELQSDAIVAKIGELCASTEPLRGDAGALTGEARQERLRRRFAHRLDRFATARLGCVHTEGERHTTLRIDGAGCDLATLERHVPAAQRPALRAIGFERLRCLNGSAEIGL
jgi:hypothetical protein